MLTPYTGAFPHPECVPLLRELPRSLIGLILLHSLMSNFKSNFKFSDYNLDRQCTVEEKQFILNQPLEKQLGIKKAHKKKLEQRVRRP